jgi:hypothetical protein
MADRRNLLTGLGEQYARRIVLHWRGAFTSLGEVFEIVAQSIA